MKIGNLCNTVARVGFWLAWLLLALAVLIPVSAISFCLAFLTVTCAVFPLAFGTRRQRIGALIVLVSGVVLAGIHVRRLESPPAQQERGGFDLRHSATNNNSISHSVFGPSFAVPQSQNPGA